MSSLEISRQDGSYLLRLRVKPKAKRAGTGGVHNGALKVNVKEAPEKGKANEALCRVLATALDLSPRDIELVSGHASRDKRVAIRYPGSEDELTAKLLGES